MNSKPSISVAIPLYNKEREIEATVRSVLGQTLLPMEIIVVDDGSTDRSAEVVRSIGSPLVRIIAQENAGVAAARNRAAREAAGEYIAYLDGDDRWRPSYLEKMAKLIAEYPGCGAYAAAFDIASNDKIVPNKSPETEGIVDDFFCVALDNYICQPSATVIPKAVMERTGGFPEGMKLGEDLYLWIKIATDYPVCFTPEALVIYNRTASNRSVGIYTPEKTVFSFTDLYTPQEAAPCRNEYIARCALGKALILSAKGDVQAGHSAEEFFAYTKANRRAWRKLHILNRIPVRMRPVAFDFYNRMAWAIARKGL